jgi:hypothetical protein
MFNKPSLTPSIMLPLLPFSLSPPCIKIDLYMFVEKKATAGSNTWGAAFDGIAALWIVPSNELEKCRRLKQGVGQLPQHIYMETPGKPKRTRGCGEVSRCRRFEWTALPRTSSCTWGVPSPGVPAGAAGAGAAPAPAAPVPAPAAPAPAPPAPAPLAPAAAAAAAPAPVAVGSATILSEAVWYAVSLLSATVWSGGIGISAGNGTTSSRGGKVDGNGTNSTSRGRNDSND